MVQRKVLNKLGIQADHVESEKGLVNHLKPSSFQHQDVKNRGADLKKKMKKSRSMKKHDFESLRSSPPPLTKEIPQPGKPPPPDDHHAPTRAATPQRQSPTKAPESPPNYMKSTSSFEARKERSQVSSRIPQAPTISKSLSPKKSNNLRHGSGCGHKAIGTLTRTSSLKLVRTLTKTPSFKPARASTRKYSPVVVLCENIDVHKPTCSSTLKDSKFPAYLTLSPGATESEGTSVMKVCPYTYCSLNGHHHAPVPPLKGFLSAKRRMLKAQKTIKLGCRSPRRVKPSGGDSITAAANDAEHVIVVADTDSEDNLNQNSYCATTDMNIIKLFAEEDQNYEAGGEEVYPLSMAEEETTLECLSKQCNSDEEMQPSNQLGQSDSEASEMEWEAGRYYEPSLHEVLVGFYDEESVSSDAWFNDGDSELDGSYQNMESDESILVCNKQSRDEINSTFDASEELTTTDEKNGNWKSDETPGKESTWAPIEDPIEQFKATTENKNGASHDSIEVYLFDSTNESRFSNEIYDESEDAEADQEDHEQEIPTADAEDRMEEKEQFIAANSFVGIQIPELMEDHEQEISSANARDGMEENDSFVGIRTFESLQDFPESNQVKIDEENAERKLDDNTKESEAKQTLIDDALPDEIQDHSSNKKSQSNDVENQENSEINQDGAKNYKITNSMNSEGHTHSGAASLRSTDKDQQADTTEGEYTSNLDAEETCSKAKDAPSTETKDTHSHVRSNANEEMPLACKNPSWTIRSKRPVEELEESRNFNPREPNYLPMEPDPESEKVDLRHQMMDERKNAEEWMVDYALRQTVTKLAPARKRKVALLVEAFEKVLPASKYEAHLSHTSAAFIHARTVQACR